MDQTQPPQTPNAQAAQVQKKVMLDCRNMLNHVLLIYMGTITRFDADNILALLEEADKVLAQD